MAKIEIWKHLYERLNQEDNLKSTNELERAAVDCGYLGEARAHHPDVGGSMGGCVLLIRLRTGESPILLRALEMHE